MRILKKLHKKLHLLTIAFVAAFIFVSVAMPVKAYIQKTGTVSEAVTLRQNADEDSKQVMELASGQEVKVNNEITDNSGMKWYQVFVNGNTMGYVPADKVSVSGASQGSSSNSESNANTNTNNSTNTTQQATQTTTQTQTVTTTERVGKVTAGSAIRVREKASTASEQVASMEANDTFLVLEDENAADGHVWYKVEFDDHGKTVYGYVRSDLVTVEEVTKEEQVQVEVPVTDVPEENTEPPYSIISQKDAEGTTKWYVLDAANGDAVEISSLLANTETNSKANGGLYKTLMIVFLFLFILAAAGATFLYMRWQEAEEFIDEIRERQQKGKRPQQPQQVAQPAPQKRPVPQTVRPVSQPVSKPVQAEAGIPGMKPLPKPTATAARPVGQPMPRPVSKPLPKPTYEPVRQPVYEPEVEPVYEAPTPDTADIVAATQRELQNNRSTVKPNSAPTWKSKNFLTDEEDDLEFDFLDMDDK